MEEDRFPQETQEVLGARRKAGLLVLGCVLAVGLGWDLTTSDGTPTVPAMKHHVIGWLNIVFFGGCGVAGIGMLLFPQKLLIQGDSFTLKTLWRTKTFFYGDIDEIWVHYNRAAASVVWLFNSSIGGFSRRMWGFDGSLPGAWELSPEELAAELREAKARYDVAS